MVGVARVGGDERREPVVGDDDRRADAPIDEQLEAALPEGGEDADLRRCVQGRIRPREDALVVQEEDADVVDAALVDAHFDALAAHPHDDVPARVRDAVADKVVAVALQ